MRTLAAAQPENFSANRHLICCTNGTLNVQTLELLPHSPGHMLRTGLNVPDDPGAQCPHFLSFLHVIFRDDEDRDERIAFLQQWFGYLLMPTSRLQLMLWLVGASRPGRTQARLRTWLRGPGRPTSACRRRSSSGSRMRIGPDAGECFGSERCARHAWKVTPRGDTGPPCCIHNLPGVRSSDRTQGAFARHAGLSCRRVPRHAECP